MLATKALRTAPTALRLSADFMRTKRSTNIAGLEIHGNPLPELVSTYTRTLDVLKALPESAVYRQSSEAVTQQRLDIVRAAMTESSSKNAHASESAIQKVVQEIDSGIIEEVLDQARDEFHLAAKMVDWKPHEPLQVPAPPGQWKGFNMAEAAGEGH